MLDALILASALTLATLSVLSFRVAWKYDGDWTPLLDRWSGRTDRHPE